MSANRDIDQDKGHKGFKPRHDREIERVLFLIPHTHTCILLSSLVGYEDGRLSVYFIFIDDRSYGL